jgi:cytoskeletal protein CcmA (bactofilin family)
MQEAVAVSVITCAVCGTKKGSCNNWLVLFEVQMDRAALIGPIDQADLLQRWREGADRFHLCGEGCLYRRLGSVLRRSAHGHQSPNETATLKAVSEVNGYPQEDQPPFRKMLRFGNVVERRSDLRTLDRSVARKSNDNLPSMRVSEIAAINQAVRITGDVYCLEPLYVNGELAGNIVMDRHRLTIGPKGRIRATVQAKEVEILGVLEGNVTADRIVIRKYGTLIGDLCANTLTIEEGACFEGRVRRANATHNTSWNSD